MTTYALHAHDLDPARVTGIARYADGLARALGPLLSSDERATLVTARSCGATDSAHTEIPVPRKYLYGSWLKAGVPRLEWLVRTADLVHATAPIVPIPTRKPLVVTIHDITPLTHPDWYSKQAVGYFTASAAWTKRRAAAVLTPTQFVADQVCEALGFDPSAVTVTGEGFDSERFECPKPHAVLDKWGLGGRDFLFFVGSLSARKGLVTVIEALPPKGPVLVLAGPDGVGHEAVHEAARLRPGRVMLLGRVTDQQIGALMRGATALVHPSSFEGFGLTVLEAMSVGTPVIVSGAGALPEVVGAAGLVVPSADREAWTQAMRVVDDPAALEVMREVGLRRSLDWTWKVAAERTLSVYRQVAPT